MDVNVLVNGNNFDQTTDNDVNEVRNVLFLICFYSLINKLILYVCQYTISFKTI